MSRYTLKFIEQIEAPDGSDNKHWYKFVIENSYNTITNTRCGSEKEIRRYAKETIQRLNEKYRTNCKVKIFNRMANETGISGSW
ncbi:MAG: hypothetical protein OQK75_04075 [Gammaproteobacteria bacterium]|nr:hypothetical protein [Gammaproteobacteria bacterium]MCW8986827.1 hypothetical protein [Gammaproteobacteria bacterium]MCW9030553.1 hypothetical protein [Gammaproteobacteria bacterium]